MLLSADCSEARSAGAAGRRTDEKKEEVGFVSAWLRAVGEKTRDNALPLSGPAFPHLQKRRGWSGSSLRSVPVCKIL